MHVLLIPAVVLPRDPVELAPVGLLLAGGDGVEVLVLENLVTQDQHHDDHHNDDHPLDSAKNLFFLHSSCFQSYA